ncbi:hypothetical protein C0J52_16612 [Blattella germanica]|nr:hypothetical protein C0J52_16612 [Blattella germanica]
MFVNYNEVDSNQILSPTYNNKNCSYGLFLKKKGTVELRHRIAAAVQQVTPDMLQRVWQEIDFRWDVCRLPGVLLELVGIETQVSSTDNSASEALATVSSTSVKEQATDNVARGILTGVQVNLTSDFVILKEMGNTDDKSEIKIPLVLLSLLADILETRLNSALKAIEDIAESRGYRKKEVKEDLMQAVSDIHGCFKILKNALVVKETEKKEPACEVNVDQEEDDSMSKGQVAASISLKAHSQIPTAQTPPGGSSQDTARNEAGRLRKKKKETEKYTNDEGEGTWEKVDVSDESEEGGIDTVCLEMDLMPEVQYEKPDWSNILHGKFVLVGFIGGHRKRHITNMTVVFNVWKKNKKSV